MKITTKQEKEDYEEHKTAGRTGQRKIIRRHEEADD